MASDEIEKAWKEYSKGCEFADPITALMSQDDFTAGYTQGRADAWRWIPVSERLPEESGDYFVIRFKGDLGSSLFYDAELKGWNLNFINGDRDNEMFPTYWMELPLPPTEAK